jgi:hypothetical protein
LGKPILFMYSMVPFMLLSVEKSSMKTMWKFSYFCCTIDFMTLMIAVVLDVVVAEHRHAEVHLFD